MSNHALWKQKLMAFLHDPPCKCFDIPGHTERAASFRQSAGIDAGEYQAFEHECDRLASAADRFPFPKPALLKSQFSGGRDTPFRHPLGGADYALDQIMQTATLAEEEFQKTIGGVPRDFDWKAKYFLYWRRWPEQSALHDPRLAFLPADTRIPDHTIWTHMSLTSALQACVEGGDVRPAFLILHLGGVQDFISQAKSTRDLWSGSYLYSWLMAHALKAIADEVGPDCIIFPNLRGQPIFDALYRDEIYSQIKFDRGDTLWTRMYPDDADSASRLLCPSLPNRALAVVPASRAAELAGAAETALREELERIGDACWHWLIKNGAQADWKDRWDRQLELFPRLAWQTLDWDSATDIMTTYRHVTSKGEDESDPVENLQQVLDLVPPEDRDSRYYENGKLKSPGNYWQAYYAIADFLSAARRNTRDFPAFVTDENQTGTLKDARSGREEIIGNEDFWDPGNEGRPGLLKEDKALGAMNLIKRLWCRTEVGYLHHQLGLNDKIFQGAVRYDSVPDVAKKNIERPGSGKSPYVAVIALDGDEMGKWVAGVKTPDLARQFSHEASEYFASRSKNLDGLLRPLSPSYHLQFSEALSNFTRLARIVVDSFAGQIVYAGGDDVVAIVPATRAMDCAYMLRCVFRGEEPTRIACESMVFAEDLVDLQKTIHFQAPGWITLTLPDGEKLPMLLPGPRADVSCGIAIGHQNHPLQAMVQEAQRMEKRAKTHFGRGALSVKLLKRGGEHTLWGGRWDGEALSLYHRFVSLSGYRDDNERLPARFPYALAELLGPYQLHAIDGKTAFQPLEILLAEFTHVAGDKRQGSRLSDGDREELLALAETYLKELEEAKDGEKQPRPGRWDEFEKLFLTAAFIHRTRDAE